MNAWLLPGVPAVAGAALAVAGRRADRAAPALGALAAAVTVALAVAAAVTRPAGTVRLVGGFASGLAVDGLSAALAVTVAVAAFAVLLFATGDRPGAEARFTGLMLIFTAAMLLTVTATDLLLLLMGWEVMGAMSYALIGFWWRDPGRVRAGGLAFVTTRAGDLGLYAAAGFAVAGAGGLELAGLAGAARPWRDLAAAGIVLAALGKSAQLPFSFWLSRAMAGPSPVSALLHSATMVAAGAYLLLRVQPLLAATGWAATLVAWAGALTALALGLVALAQRDLKQLLAASTCAQIGFLVLAAGAAAISAGAAHLAAHAAVKSLLFLCAGAWLATLGTESLAALRGAARRDRLAGLAFAAGALSLAGIPPLALWVTKGAVLTAVTPLSLPLYGVALAASLTAAAYSARALLILWARPAPGAPAGPPRDRRAGAAPLPGSPPRLRARGISPAGRVSLAGLALGALGFGAVALPPVADAWSRLTGSPPRGEFVSPAELAVSAVLALAVLAAVAVRRHARPAPAAPPAVRHGDARPDAVRHGDARRAGRHRGDRAGAVRRGRTGGGTAGGGWQAGRYGRYGRYGRRALGEWLWLERAAVAVAWRPLPAVARALAWVDDRVIDGAVRGVARAAVAVARVSGREGEGVLDGVVRGVAGGVAWLGGVARRPQTGQAHTYFAQAAVALVVLAVVIGAVGAACSP
ncbi:proton-conducting transporter membrane subunit [Bailinhaonella thermotolerans]|uniref:NADH-quinone oxidoreductase subunit L n=1 Tax=Bailinhaonella thermotolerans TaxID=1070861 RepID=A0A3A4A9W8_9ACTN|nr:proton-conducting transporter membrane subunit [Bailinhaonella thermotolerans]RJL24839.1 NADH-quinone oxidoreductase subunit L [Bailinhaonella thermotolerans]